jgi:histidinol-phosphate aminotransferase
MPSVPLRADLPAIPAYIAGKPARAGRGASFKLSSNESPFPPDPAVVRAVTGAASGANRYPSATGAGLVALLARRWAVPESRLVVGGGSISLLQLLVQAVTDPGEAVVYAWRSYEAYPIVIPVSHARPVPIPTREHRHDLGAMAEAVRRTHARMVLVCSPNNPTGTAVGAAELDEFIAAVPRDCLIVLDEAYAEFNNAPDRPDGFALAASHPNVAVLRTFSKAYGLAGMRIGYCAAPASVADAMRRISLPFTLSAVAEAAGMAALEAWPRQAQHVREIIERRDSFAAELAEAGFDIPVSRANFVWLPLGEKAAEADEALRDAGISVRTFPGDGVRITIGEAEAMAATLTVLRALPRG